MALKDHVRWLLPASLLVNAFAAGAVVSQFAHPQFGPGHHGPPPGPPGPPELARMVAEDMDPADRAVVSKAFDAEASALEASDRKLQQARDQIKQALDAPQLDQDALKTGLSGLRDALDAHGAAIAAAIVEAAGSLSPEGRKHLAARTPPGGGPPDGPPPR